MGALTIFIFLLFAHYIGDFALQTPFMSEYKAKLWYVMLAHCMVYTGTISFVLLYFDAFQLLVVPWLLVGHWIMDKWKADHPNEMKYWWTIYPDQAWHIFQIAVIVILL